MITVEIDDAFGGIIEVPLWECIVIAVIPPAILLAVAAFVKFIL